MVDDFGGSKPIFSAGVIELGCMARTRRKFFELNYALPNAIAHESLVRVDALYDIERRGGELAIEERTVQRHNEALPLRESLHAWLKTPRVTLASGGASAQAIDYRLKRWPSRSRYATDGALPSDINTVENAIRPVWSGKKHWRVVAAERAGQRAPAIQSLLAIAALNRVDRAIWLRKTLENLSTCLNSEVNSPLLLVRAL